MKQRIPPKAHDTLLAAAADPVALRRQANRDLPIFRLPAEILILIFDECRQEDILYLRILWRGEWIACTHVCHCWRTIALAAPVLWHNVGVHPAVDEEALKAWFMRSVDSPLKMTIGEYWAGDDLPNPQFSEGMLDTVAQGLSRAKILDVAGVGHDLMMSLRWPDSVPSLDQLAVRIEERTISFDIHETFSRNVAARFPGLKRFRSNVATFDFKNWTLPHTLTELHVSGSGKVPAYTLDDVLEVLQRLPCLEFLIMNDATPIDTAVPHTRAVRQPVALPSLRYLFLSGLLETQVAMLDVINLGPSVRLTLDLLLRDTFEQTALLIRPPTAYLRKIKALRGVAITIEDKAKGYGDVRARGGCRFAFKAWSDPQTLESMRNPADQYTFDETPSDALLDLSFSVWEQTLKLTPALIRDSLAPLERLLSTFPLSDVGTLALCCAYGPVFNAPQVYCQMTQLHTLCITATGGKSGGLRDTLQRFDLAQGVGDGTIVFPKLSVLALSGVQCRDAHQPFLELLERRQRLLASEISASDSLQVLLYDCWSLTPSFPHIT